MYVITVKNGRNVWEHHEVESCVLNTKQLKKYLVAERREEYVVIDVTFDIKDMYASVIYWHRELHLPETLDIYFYRGCRHCASYLTSIETSTDEDLCSDCCNEFIACDFVPELNACATCSALEYCPNKRKVYIL